MKFEIEKSIFAEALGKTTSYLQQRPIIPALAGVILKVDAKGALSILAANDEVSIIDFAEAQKHAAGSCLVPGRQLADIVRTLPNEAVKVFDDEKQLHIESGKAKFVITKMVLDQFPELPKHPEAIGSIDAATFEKAVDAAFVSTMKTDEHPQLNGILMQFSAKSITLLSTDRFRLTKIIVPWKSSGKVPAVALVKGSVLSLSSKNMTGGDGFEISLEADEDGNARLFGLKTNQILTSNVLSADKFPSLDELFKSDYLHEITVNKAELLESLGRASTVTVNQKPVILEITAKSIKVSGGEEAEAVFDESIEATVDSENPGMKVSFNPNYLIEGIKSIPKDYLHIKLVDEFKPVEFTGIDGPEGKEDANYKYLLVPVRLFS